MSSKRLPGKMLRPLLGQPLLQWVIQRVRHSDTAREIVVATSAQPEDDRIYNLAKKNGVECFRGGLEDVRSRFVEFVRSKQISAFVRISGDSPMIDPLLIDQAVTIFKSGNYDLVTNVRERTFPKGQSVEVLRGETFLNATLLSASAAEMEHVTHYYYTNPASFRILNFKSEINYSQVQLSVDTYEDLIRMQHLMEACDPQTVRWIELVEIVDQLESKKT